MQAQNNKYSYTKNKRRLIAQNIKIHAQVMNIQKHVEQWYEKESSKDQSMLESTLRPVVTDIQLQEKAIRRLRQQIEGYKLERAKDNVEYIVREEDHLKIMRKQELQLTDQKEILLSRKLDKKESLLKDVPYQNYEKRFLQELTEVVKFNRDQGAKITQIQREIRKYHMIKKSKGAPAQKVINPNDLVTVECQIADKIADKKNLEERWKSHFENLDTQFAHLLHQSSKKKEECAEIEREEKNWETRVSAITDADVVLRNKSRVGSVKVSTKLRQKVKNYIKQEEERHIKKVSQEELKMQFAEQSLGNNKEKEKKEQEKKKIEEEKNKPSNMPPPLPGQKKKEQKITETLHNDKNITKKIEKPPKNNKVKEIPKSSQDCNTQLSIPPKKQNKTPKEQSPRLHPKKALLLQEQQQQKPQTRVWEQSKEQQEPNAQIKSTPKSSQKAKGNLVQMKEVGLTTTLRDWEQPA